MKEYFIELLNFDAWASKRQLFCLKELVGKKAVEESLTEQVLHSYHHLLGAQGLWLSRMRYAVDRTPFENTIRLAPKGLTIEKVLEDLESKHLLLDEWMDTLTAKQWEKLMNYEDMESKKFQNTPIEIFSHLINHGTHHRAQVASLFRANGHTPPPIDFIYFCRRENY